MFPRQVRGGKKENRHADSSDKQLHSSLFGRQVGMSSGPLVGHTTEYSRNGGENGQRENTAETNTDDTGFYFILILVLLIEHV